MILREMSFYFLTLILTVSSITYVIPNLSTNPKDYRTINKIVDTTRVMERNYEDKYGKQVERTLAISATDGYEIYISQGNVDNWHSLVETDFRAKKLEALLRNASNGNLNPKQLKLDGKIIISNQENTFYGYIILSLTLVCILYSIYLAKSRLKTV